MIRPYRPSDLPALRRICVLTGRAGGDATGQWSSDDLLPDVFLEPFVVLEPSTAWVVQLDDTPVGYLVGTLDTRAFVDRWRSTWAAEFTRRHPHHTGEWLYDAGTDPSRMLQAPLDDYPAHLHIDLLPRAQGGGWGRALMRQLGVAAVAAGVPGIHLGMARDNTGALAFYKRLGFVELTVTDDTLVLGIDPVRLV